MADATVSIVKEECFLDEILNELPNRVAKPTPTVKGKNLSVSKLFHQISDSLKDLHLVYTCVDASSVVIALGTNVGNAFIYQRNQRKILKISSDTKYIPTTCIKLAAGCGAVAFAHESGTFAVGLVDPPIHRSFDSLTAKDIHCTAVTCLEWSSDGLILYAGDSEGKISMSVVKISEGILQTAVIITEDDSVVQLSYGNDGLLASTIKRTLIWSFQTENIIQVGEKERKMYEQRKGSFGCCFIPDNLQEPSKKLYAVRPGQRIWTADGSGKVSSTSVFKTLLADKPQTIYTLTGNDKANSGGQFGHLLIYYKKFVVTWDQSHLWILDLDKGAVIGCHSNLGKIRDVTVSGHELFVLLNQRERFLRRFTLVNEDLGPSCLDAVIAIRHHDVDQSPLQAAEKSEEKTTDNDSVVPATVVETQNKIDGMPLPETVVPADDLFHRINAISLDCEKGDIVFTGAKKKKKKKKVKQVSDETKSLGENQGTSEPRADNVSIDSSKDQTSEETVSKNETPTAEIPSGSAQPASSDIALEEPKSETEVVAPLQSNTPTQNRSPVLPRGDNKNELRSVSPDEVAISDQQAQENTTSTDKETHSSKESPVPAQGDGDRPHTAVVGAVAISNRQTSENAPSNTEEIRTSHELDETTKQASDQSNSEETPSAQQLETPSALEEVNEINANEQDQDVTEDTSVLPVANKPDPEHLPLKSGDVPAASDIIVTMSQREDSMESGDEYHVLEETSDYLQSDSYQPGSFGGLGKLSESKQGEDKQQDEDPHAPLFADTWSKRAVPTVHAIESLAISEKYVFCANAHGEVYYSDPNTASCHGWEQTDWKAKQIYIDSSCKHIIYKGKGNKAFVRGNVGSMHPVGNASFQIMEDVDLLASCSVCSWVISVNGDFRRAESSALMELKGDLKNPRIWCQEDSKENLCQIACYHNVLWGRTVDESLTVYTGRSGGKKATWITIEEKKAKWVSMSDDGTIWIITPDDQIWFNPGISVSTPTGEVWHQVSLGEYIIDDASVLGSAYNFFQSVGSAYRNSRTTAQYLRHAAKGLIQSTRDMAYSIFRDGGYPKQIYCNTQSGVWLLDTKNALHACRGQITGAYWKPVCPTGTAQSATWRRVSTGLGSYVWALQPNGELTCFNPNGPSYNVAGPSSKESLDFITSSPHGVWCFSSNMPNRIYVRDGISEGYPQGFAWVSLSLRHHEIEDVKHISVGRITVWAVDNSGNVWLRIGSVHGDESTVLSQAWVPIDGPPHAELSTVEVNAKDSMVWVTDAKGNVYARDGVSDDYLIGNSWREVPGATLKSVCLSSCVVYGLCTNGEIVCRFGVSPANCTGDYWKKVPGNFAQMSISEAGELWVINEEDWLFTRKTKCLFGKLASKDAAKKQEVVRDKKDLVQVVDVSDVGGDSDGDDDDDGGDWELL